MAKYSCNEFREEMVLLGLRRRLNHPDTTKEEKKELLKEISQIEKKMGLE